VTVASPIVAPRPFIGVPPRIASFTGRAKQLAVTLSAATADEADVEKAAKAALRRFAEQRATWLLVYDNATAPDHIADLLPSAGARVLITSRFLDWSELADEVPLDVLSLVEAVTFLQSRTGHSDAAGAACALLLALALVARAVRNHPRSVRLAPGSSICSTRARALHLTMSNKECGSATRSLVRFRYSTAYVAGLSRSGNIATGLLSWPRAPPVSCACSASLRQRNSKLRQ